MWRHIGIAIAVATHPRPETNRCGLNRQPFAGIGAQSTVDSAQVTRDHVPQGLLNDGQAPGRFIERPGRLTPNFVGVPYGKDFALQIGYRFLSFRWCQIGAVPAGQALSHTGELMHEGAAHNFSGMGG